MNSKIEAIDYFLPEKTLYINDLAIENPDWEMDRIVDKAGVVKVHIAESDTTALDLGYQAVKRLFGQDGSIEERVDGIIFCTQSADYIMPPNSCVLHGKLGLREDIFAVDINHACSGFVYGLSIANGLISSGALKNILLVTADTYSKYIHKQDRSARSLFGDGAAATLISATTEEKGLLDSSCATFGKGFDAFIVEAGGSRLPISSETKLEIVDDNDNVRTPEHLHMEGRSILGFVNTRIPKQVKGLLQSNNLIVDDVDLFVFHQASKMALDSLGRLLKIPQEKNFRYFESIGNTVSSSICIRIKTSFVSVICSE